MDQKSLWWNYVSGAARYLSDTAAASANYRVLIVEEAPYMEHFFCLLQDRLHQWDSNLQIDEIRADQWTFDVEVGESLINHYASQVDYHPMDGTRAQFIARNDLLAGRVLIVRETNRRTEWIDTAIEYARFSSERNGLLILTYNGHPYLNSSRKGVKLLQWETYVTNYDMQLFASYCIADKPGLSLEMRNYITQLASRLAGTDAVLCSRLAVEEIAVDAMGLMQRLAHDNVFAGRVFANPQFIQSKIWESQIQIVFPIIERWRRRFIEQYNNEFLSVLPQQDDFDKELNTPQDMELRHMWYYYFKLNGFRHSDDERAFWLLYQARNHLAHLEPLYDEDVSNLILLDA